ncbi:MAG TPA: 6-phosphofructokinase [Firmicutes bacterium]|nr:6-phosphofructokinase [Bacillota bacterium]HWR55027.1 6-phosphofructokinase [Negativicutes bacterium]
MLKSIAVLTSGGDSPGMNAAIRAVVRAAKAEQMEVFGIRNGYAGLIAGDMVQLNSRSVGDIIQRGGTFLGTARSEEFRTPAGQQKAAQVLREKNVEGLVVIGGDGSLRGARALSEFGFRVIGLPGTIDNDMWGTDYTIGFDTAVNNVLDAINKLRDTASAHGRVMVVEVMGRHSGWIGLTSGLAGGAELILIPEFPFTLPDVCQQLRNSRAAGKLYSIVVIAEGAGSGVEIGKEIHAHTGLDTRVSVLGHIQRGGAPTVFDRVLASNLGAAAVALLREGKSNLLVGCQNAKIVPVDINVAAGKTKPIDEELYALAGILSR